MTPKQVRGCSNSMPEQDLKSKLEKLHNLLNEYYSVDSSWKKIDEWPKGETGSIMYPGATDEEIARAEKKFGQKFPPSYKEFLKLCSGWAHCWGDDTFIGTARPDTKRAQDKIAEYKKWQIDFLREDSTEEWPAAATAWEAAGRNHLYLSNHLVIATNFRAAAWVFDIRTRDSNGEMKLTFWEKSYGAQEPTFQNFYEYLDFAIGEVEFRLDDWYKTYPKDKKKKAKPKKVSKKK